MRRTLYLICLLALIGAVSGTVGHEEVQFDLENNDMQINLYVEDLSASNLTYVTSYSVNNLESHINEERADCTVEELQIGAEISCETEQTENFSASFRFEAEDLTSHQGNIEKFQYSRVFRVPTNNYTLRVILPRSSSIVDDENLSQPSISPGSGQVRTDGQRIYVEWKLNPTIGGEPNNFQVLYTSRNNERLPYRYLALGILAIILLVTIYFSWKKISKQSIESVYPDLKDDEIEILEVIADNGGEMLQKDVVSESEYSKAKISGVVSTLVEREIILKEKEGRSNKLKIDSRFKLD